METAAMKPHNDFEFPFHPSHTKSFLIVAAASANGIHSHHYKNNNETSTPVRCQVSDIEMVALQAAYTSLRDLLPTSPSSVVSPTTSRKDSWREIPIKDPLVQHAAWAYLQPMSEARDSDDHRNLLEKLKEKCCGLFACFTDMFFVFGKGLFSESDVRTTTEADEEANYDDHDGVDQKVN